MTLFLRNRNSINNSGILKRTVPLLLTCLLVISVLGLAFVSPAHAQTIVPIGSSTTTFTSGSPSTSVTFTAVSGDIIAVSISYMNNNNANAPTPSVSDGSDTYTQQIRATHLYASSQVDSDAEVWTTTAGASGSLTVTVSFSSVGSGSEFGMTVYQLSPSYSLTGLATASATGDDSTPTLTMALVSTAVASQSAVIGAGATWRMTYPASSTAALGFISYPDCASLSCSGAGVSFFNGGFVGTSTFPVTAVGAAGGAFLTWSEVILILPETAETSTTTTTTTTTSTTTSTVTTTITTTVTDTTTTTLASTTITNTVTTTTTSLILPTTTQTLGMNFWVYIACCIGVVFLDFLGTKKAFRRGIFMLFGTLFGVVVTVAAIQGNAAASGQGFILQTFVTAATVTNQYIPLEPYIYISVFLTLVSMILMVTERKHFL